MVIAALISFGILLVAWITAPGDEPRREVLPQGREVDLPATDGLARAA